MDKISVGDRVQFTGRRGPVEGTVTDEKYSRPGSRNQLVKAYGIHTPQVRMLSVMPDGESGLWSVPERMCTKIGKGDATAKVRASDLLTKIHLQRSDRESQGRETADSAGLYNLKKGDDIEVKYRDVGWQRRKFSHLTKSGTVGYYREGDVRPSNDPINRLLGTSRDELHVRFTPAQFVRKPAA